MEQAALERYPAQLPPKFYKWAQSKAKDLGVPIAEIWRVLPDVLQEAEQEGIDLMAQEVGVYTIAVLRPRQAQA